MGVLPNSLHGSLTFNNKITSYDLLAQRVKYMMGYPLVQIEITDEQMYSIIDTACEYFTKFSGMTEEFLIFRSDLYIPQVGLPIGRLINITPDMVQSYATDSLSAVSSNCVTEYNEVIGDGVNNSFKVIHNLNSNLVSTEIYDANTHDRVFTSIQTESVSAVNIHFSFVIPPSSYEVVVINGETATETTTTTVTPGISAGNYGWDYDLNNYRSVIDVSSFQEGSNTGINTLFTIEHAIAQQAYFGHLLGNVGYDLVTWNALKGWIELREKTLALTPYLRFYPETQMLKIIPEPTQNSVYFGLVKCKVQKPIKQIVSQLWVYRYSLALTKIVVGHARGKFAGGALFGGQTVNYSDLMSQGLAEKDKLEAEITSDLIDRDPIPFIIG